jgi:hypothetical protein
MTTTVPDDWVEVNARVAEHILGVANWVIDRYAVDKYLHNHSRECFMMRSLDGKFFVPEPAR